jgi:phosphoribosylglycinamide formyltransferase-1
VLLSGRGSNFRAIAEAQLPIELAAVISNRPQAAGLDYARERGIPAVALDHTEHPDREAFDALLADEIERHRPDLVVLAGYLRILSPAFIARFEGRLLNIQPSLLPMFPGLKTHERALAEGVKLHGCTVHFVTPSSTTAPSSSRPRCRCSPTTRPTPCPRACWRRNTASIRWRCAGSPRGGW